MDKIPNWTKSRMGENPEWTKSRIGQNPELDKIPHGKNPERAKSRMSGLIVYLQGQVFATFFTASDSFLNTKNLCSTMF